MGQKPIPWKIEGKIFNRKPSWNDCFLQNEVEFRVVNEVKAFLDNVVAIFVLQNSFDVEFELL